MSWCDYFETRLINMFYENLWPGTRHKLNTKHSPCSLYQPVYHVSVFCLQLWTSLLLVIRELEPQSELVCVPACLSACVCVKVVHEWTREIRDWTLSRNCYVLKLELTNASEGNIKGVDLCCVVRAYRLFWKQRTILIMSLEKRISALLQSQSPLYR